MTDIEELILAADKLCNSLSAIASNDRVFSEQICQDLESMAWQSWMIASDLKLIKEQVAYV